MKAWTTACFLTALCMLPAGLARAAAGSGTDPSHADSTSVSASRAAMSMAMGGSALARPASLAIAVVPATFVTDAEDGCVPLLLAAARGRPAAARGPTHRPVGLEAERARILLRSLTVPGWGQATLGHSTSAAVFGIAEAAIWGTFTAFRIQDAIRQDSYLRMARQFAGIDLQGRNEEWRRIVGGFSSSDEYNRLVVARDAANLYYNDPLAYRAYIEEHSLKGTDVWSWSSPEAQERYRSERKYAQRAAQRANTALAIAVANRILSAVHAARLTGHREAAKHSWRLEAVPVTGRDPAAFQLRVRAQF
jgi:hypothetical protein